MDEVINALENYLHHILDTRIVSVDEFKNLVEPAFIKAGYRNPPKLGEQLNVLIMHDAAIGDFVLLSGVIREIRRIYPDAHITLMIQDSSLPLAEDCPYFDEFVLNGQVYKANVFNELYSWNLFIAKIFLTRRYHICYAFVHRPNTPLLAYMSGANIRIAHNPKDVVEAFVIHYDEPPQNVEFGMRSTEFLMGTLEMLMTHLIPMDTYGEHFVDTRFSFIDNALRAPVANRELELWLTALDKFEAQKFLQSARSPIYALAMGGREIRKHYPPENYARLVEMILREDSEATFVILGGGKDDEVSAQTFKENLDEKIFAEHVIDLTNKTHYRQSAAILECCDMYIGNDTGIMHVAAAAKCPVLTPNCAARDIPPRRFDYVRFFSPYHVPSVTVQPAHALPECVENTPYNQYGCRADKPHCITQITPELLFGGYKLLKDKIAAKDSTSTFMW